jgi:hypothetical protein
MCVHVPINSNRRGQLRCEFLPSANITSNNHPEHNEYNIQTTTEYKGVETNRKSETAAKNEGQRNTRPRNPDHNSSNDDNHR